MYGLVNQAICDLVTTNYGTETWHRIKNLAGVSEDRFIVTEVYDDKVTYSLVGAAAEALGVTPEDVLKMFGEFWVTYVDGEGYGSLLSASGASFSEFVENLDQFHSRLAVTYPKFLPPSFECEILDDERIELTYTSKRPGLHPMMVGILQGLAKRYNTEIDIEVVQEEQSVRFLLSVVSETARD